MFSVSLRLFFMMLACAALFSAPLRADDALILSQVNAGDEVVLEDGRVVRLQGIMTPPAGSGKLADQAVALIHKVGDDAEVVLDSAFTDRYGRTDAQVYVKPADGGKIWLQHELLKQGLAFVYPPVGDETRIEDMLHAEAAARQAHRGLWADPAYADVPARAAQDLYGRFAFVTGKVLKAARVKNVIYLNFGADWRSDFTVSIAAHDLKAFRKADIDPLTYEGQMIRVRGWVTRKGGPMILATTPYQIQVIK